MVNPEELKAWRIAYGITQEGLGEYCGLSKRTIQKFEYGEPQRKTTTDIITYAWEYLCRHPKEIRKIRREP